MGESAGACRAPAPELECRSDVTPRYGHRIQSHGVAKPLQLGGSLAGVRLVVAPAQPVPAEAGTGCAYKRREPGSSAGPLPAGGTGRGGHQASGVGGQVVVLRPAHRTGGLDEHRGQAPIADRSALAALIHRRSNQDRGRSHLMHSGSPRFVVTSPCTLIRTLACMGTRRTDDYHARRRERERQRRHQQERAMARQDRAPVRASVTTPPSSSARRAAATACGWCSSPITPRASGPIPKWCSNTCRKRAWEQKRAAAFGRSAVEIVERVVTVPAQQPLPLPRQLAWVDSLRVLAQQLDSGVIYDRHLFAIAGAAQDVLRAAQRRGLGAHPPVVRWE